MDAYAAGSSHSKERVTAFFHKPYKTSRGFSPM
jgi:hypothetical protein